MEVTFSSPYVSIFRSVLYMHHLKNARGQEILNRKEQLECGNWDWERFTQLPNMWLLVSVEPTYVPACCVLKGDSFTVVCTAGACWEGRSGQPLNKLLLQPQTSFAGVINLSRSRLNVMRCGTILKQNLVLFPLGSYSVPCEYALFPIIPSKPYQPWW